MYKTKYLKEFSTVRSETLLQIPINVIFVVCNYNHIIIEIIS
jgi:hypothetical protein